MKKELTLLTIYLTDYCNLSCRYCLAQKYNRKGDDLKPIIVADTLLQWIHNHCDPEQWCIEFTGGGEPCLHPEWQHILNSLSSYKIIVRTNGTIPFEKRSNCAVVATWHAIQPIIYDTIHILKIDDWEEKQIYCESHNIKHVVRNVKNYNLPKSFNKPEEVQPLEHKWKWQVILPNGMLVKCNKGTRDSTKRIQNDTPAFASRPCGYCTSLNNFERDAHDLLLF